MNKLSLILPLLLTVAAARADVLVVQKMESSMLNGDITMKIKGDKGRVDMPAGPLGQMSMIIDAATDDVNTLMHGQKMVIKMSGAQRKAAVEQSKTAAGATGEMEKPKATAKTETKSPAGKVSVTITKAVEQTIVAKDFQIPADYQKMDMPTQPK